MPTLCEFLPESRPHAFAPGANIYLRPTHLCYVVSGIVRVHSTLPRGEMVSHGMLGAGSFFGESSVTGSVETEAAHAITESQVIMWEPSLFTLARQRSDEVFPLFLRVLETRHERMRSRLEEMYLPMLQRVAMFLLRLDGEIGYEDGGVRVMPAIPHLILSREIGTSREMFTSRMNILRRSATVRYDRHKITLYVERLAKIATGPVVRQGQGNSKAARAKTAAAPVSVAAPAEVSA